MRSKPISTCTAPSTGCSPKTTRDDEMPSYNRRLPASAACAASLADAQAQAKIAAAHGDRETANKLRGAATAEERGRLQAHERACQEIFESRNRDEEAEHVDLLGLHSKEAVHMLGACLDARARRGFAGWVKVYVGETSRLEASPAPALAGAGPVRAAVEQSLVARNAPWRRDPRDAGALLVYVGARPGQSESSFSALAAAASARLLGSARSAARSLPSAKDCAGCGPLARALRGAGPAAPPELDSFRWAVCGAPPSAPADEGGGGGGGAPAAPAPSPVARIGCPVQ
eukprot:tig00000448_g850.t1